jgi:hypothetical protein
MGTLAQSALPRQRHTLQQTAPVARLASPSGPVSVSPQPDTPDASPLTQISLLGPPPGAFGAITVSGSRSGAHTGRLLAYSNGQGASFVPDHRFASGEQVHVRVEAKPGGLASPLDYQFTIARRAPAPPFPTRISPTRFHLAREKFVSRRDLFPPRIAVTQDNADSAPGDIFVAPLTTISGSGQKVAQRGPMILDPHGKLVWFHPLHGRIAAENFRPQVYQGKPVLTWWQGRIDPLGFGQGDDLIWDSNYRLVGHVGGSNGYRPDLHEFSITPQGSAWVTIYTPAKADLSSIGGPKHGSVLDGVIQEVDVATGLVMFEWHSLGHIGLDETYATGASEGDFNYTHLNSIQDLGDRILISARNTSAIYEVSVQTGHILWRLGGKLSTFQLGPGARFSLQHDAHLEPDGNTLTVFDNQGDRHTSRGLVLTLDTPHRTATLVRQFTHPRPLNARTQGSVQLLPNGDAFLGWGSERYFSEFDRSGQLLFDARFPAPMQSYRAFRYPWHSQPPIHPVIATRASGGGRVTVYATWNGATDVRSWQVVAGPSPTALSPIATVDRSGFETAIPVRTSQRFVAVQALDSRGRVLDTSKVVRT